MELVKGIPITDFCDQNHLTPRQRLELFLQVCGAIQHAHQKGVIHRDLKPSNILVSRHDTTPVVKVIDFGIAKAQGQDLTDKTLYTGVAQMVGTPLYMSPKQAGMSDLDVDTRSDVYSLGVPLYELLTGATPFDRERLKAVGYDEMRRIIREEEPVRPSTRLSTLGLAAATVSADRGSDPRKLSALIRGELDWVVMKALEKDRTCRYTTAAEFAADVGRYLADEPVLACPPSASYRLRKFARRNRRVLAPVVVVACTLVLATAVSVWQAVRATRAEGQSLANAQAAGEQRSIAQEQGRIAKEQGLLAQRHFHVAQTNLAQHARQAGDLARVLDLLETLRPTPDQLDLRGFDWYYLWRLSHQSLHRTLPHQPLPGAKGNGVYSLAVTPNGKTLVSGCQDSRVRVWDTATGEMRAALDGHRGLVWRVAISPDGRTAASAGNDCTVKLWDLGSYELVATLGERKDPVRSIAFSPDGEGLAIGTEAGAVEFWNLRARNRLLTLPAHATATKSLAYSPDGRVLVSGASWGTSTGPGFVKVWDLTAEPYRTLFQVPESEGVAFSPNGKLLATCGSGVSVWTIPEGRAKATLASRGSKVNGGVINSIAFSADGDTLVLGGQDRTVKLWRYAGNATRLVGVHLRAVNTVAYFPRGNLLASASDDGTVKQWSPEPPQDAIRFTQGGLVRSLDFTRDSARLVVGASRTHVLDAGTGKETTTLPVNDVCAGSEDANFLVGSTPDGKRVSWDVAAGQPRTELRIESSPIFWGALSRDGKTLATWVWGPKLPEHSVQLWDLETATARSLSEENIWTAAFSPDGQTLVLQPI